MFSVLVFVTPCVGVWIEIVVSFISISTSMKVTPCVGVWIEIGKMVGKNKKCESLPAWECGLKSFYIGKIQ